MPENLRATRIAEAALLHFEALVRSEHHARCLVQGCYYGLATQSNACVYCGTPRRGVQFYRQLGGREVRSDA